MEKSEWRVWARERRANLDIPYLSRLLVSRIRDLPLYQDATQVLLYFPMPNEIDLLSLCEDRNKDFFLPRCQPKRQLTFHRYSLYGETTLIPNAFGVKEPSGNAPQWEALVGGTLVIVPALLADERCHRLGYGGGYYDRFLPTLPLGATTLIALPDALVLPELPTDAWDIPVDIVLTA